MIRPVLVCLILACVPARAEGTAACLPASALAKDPEQGAVTFKLGFAGGVPTLCLPGPAGPQRCWTVDARNGALAASAATRLAGRSVEATPDAGGCVEGFCVTPKPGADGKTLLATSTDGAHAVVLADRTLHVFDAKTKVQTAVIPVSDPKAPAERNIGNEPVAIHVRKSFVPYFEVEPIRLPGGDMLVAMSGQYLGTLAVLDGTTLAEKRRLTLKRCGG